VLSIEAEAVHALAPGSDETFAARGRADPCRQGRVIVSGVGKSGHIGRNFAATLASTGTPAYFVHAAEAAHGDLGMITADDVLIAISYSGSERRTPQDRAPRQAPGRPPDRHDRQSGLPLAREADVHLDGRVA
jgi:arabinose-5-phosphate isomerase